MDEITDEVRELLQVLAATAKCASPEEIVEKTGLSKETVDKHLATLKDLGLVSKDEEGKKFCNLESVRDMQVKFKRVCELCKKEVGGSSN